jgi:hypothetical protein
MERNRKLNVDNIGTVVKDYTFINRREGTSDVLPEHSLDAGMGRVGLGEEGEKGEKGEKGKKGGEPVAAAAKGTSSGSGSTSSSTLAPAAAASAAASAGAATAGSGSEGGKGNKGADVGVGPHSEIEAAESYNNFALTHEVRIRD